MFKVNDSCVYYDSKKRKLREGVVKSITYITQINEDGEDIYNVLYYVQCGGSHITNIDECTVFKSREQFLHEVL